MEPMTTSVEPDDPLSASDQDEKNDKAPDTDEKVDANDDASPPPPLYKSRRFKGYLTVCLASIINFNAAVLSDNPIDVSTIPASKAQKAYAQGVAMVSAIVTGALVCIHLDRYSPLESTVWRRAFQPKSKFETVLILFLLLWWSVAAIIQTSVRGIAGDGKQQYNLYYSTWVCYWTCLWIAERKLVDFGYPTFRSFVTSWPHRAPGWIAVFIQCFFTLWWYLDLFNNTQTNPDRIPPELESFYAPIPRSQYQWLIFVAAFTLLPSGIFIIVEILRGKEDETLHQQQQLPTLTPSPRMMNLMKFDTSSHSDVRQLPKPQQPEKKSGEIILEGFCLSCLTICWIPCVIVATTPGGFASLVGNAYFCTWGTTVFVLETFSWFIHDWRNSVHRALQVKEWEYQRHQHHVLEMTLQKVHEEQARMPTDVDDEDDDDDDDDDDSQGDDDYSSRGDHEDDDNDMDHPMHDDDDGDEEKFIVPASLETIHISNRDSSDEDTDNDAARELRLKQANEKAYFDNLEDILE